MRIIADTLNFVQGVAVVIRESSKRKALFQSLFGTEDVVWSLSHSLPPPPSPSPSPSASIRDIVLYSTVLINLQILHCLPA